MIRELTAALLALPLALGCVHALAEEAAYTPYIPHQGYAVEYPSNYVLMDAGTIASIADAVMNGGLEGTNIDPATLGAFRVQIGTLDIVAFYHASGTNVSIATMNLDGRDLHRGRPGRLRTARRPRAAPPVQEKYKSGVDRRAERCYHVPVSKGAVGNKSAAPFYCKRRNRYAYHG